MERLRYIKLGKKEYALNFSTKATKAVVARYGDIANLAVAFSDKPIAEVLDEVIWLLELLINQGADYLEFVDGEQGNRVTAEQLEVIVGFDDIAGLKDNLFGAMAAGLDRTVEVEADNSKNATATQGD